MANDFKENLSYTQKLVIARRYTNENEHIAREIVNGNYYDMVAVKARYRSEDTNHFGAFILHLSIELRVLMGSFICYGDSPNIYKLKPFDTWRVYEGAIKDIIDFHLDRSLIVPINKLFIDKMGSDIITKVLSYTKVDNYYDLKGLFIGVIGDLFNIKNITMQIDTEKLTSIDFDLGSKVHIKRDVGDLTKVGDELAVEDKLAKEEVSLVGPVVDSNQFADNMILSGKVVLSPVNGKEIQKVVIGDYIKVLITEESEKAINIANKLLIYDMDKKAIKVVSGKVVGYNRSDEEYEMYILIAPYILVRVSETEDVKVAIASSTSEVKDEKEGAKYLIILLLVLSFLVLVIVLTLLLYID